MFSETFQNNGWLKVQLAKSSLIEQIRLALLQKLREITKNTHSCLESYHELGLDNEEHIDIQHQMTQFYRSQKFPLKIVVDNLSLFREIIGLDISLQENAYLRIARPHVQIDNLGYHRDTFYGGTPYELSFFVPFVNLEVENTLGFISGSHCHEESRYQFKQIQNPDDQVKKGSKKHSLGFLYAPKVMGDEIDAKIEKVPVKVGEALIFLLPVVHGCKINLTSTTRWSSDIRVCSTYAPIDLGERFTSYTEVSHSPVTKCAKLYNEACQKHAILQPQTV